MKTIILCGGLGTRLREETGYRPKPMVEVGGKPILWHIMKTYAHYGFNDFVLALGYRGDVIKEYFLNYESMSLDFTIRLGRHSSIEHHGQLDDQEFSVTLAETGAATMTGGRVSRLRKYIDGDTFMVTYGDGLIDVDLQKVLEFHRSHGKLATLTSVRPFSRFGTVEIDQNDYVGRFLEKPLGDSWVNAGYFVFDRRILDYLGGDDCILEKGPLETLAAEGQLMAYRHSGFFFAMDTFREYQAINQMWNDGDTPWTVWK